VYAGWHSFPYGWFCLLLRNIIFAWVVTVPIATGLSALMMVILKAVAL
jgi:phosphate/sulfate permease